MKLLFIYGPPAAGKLTVAQQIADQTNFRLFHNHLTIDLAKEIFDDRNIRNEIVSKIRLDIFESAAKANINLIFTYVYAKPIDDEYVSKIVTLIENNGGEVCFVQLVSDSLEIEKRVTHPSRQPFAKIKDPVILRRLLADNDLYSAVPHTNNLAINNTNTDPDIVANRVIDHFGLLTK